MVLCAIGEGVHVAGRMRTRGHDSVEPSGPDLHGLALPPHYPYFLFILFFFVVGYLALEHVEGHVGQVVAVGVVLQAHAREVRHEEDVRVVRPGVDFLLDALELGALRVKKKVFFFLMEKFLKLKKMKNKKGLNV